MARSKTNNERQLSTADLRRETMIASAVKVFAKTGYYGTTVADVAKDAGISPAYIFRLFPSKEELFVAAVDRCYARIVDAVLAIAGVSETRDSSFVLSEIGLMYTGLIGDSALLMLQVQAQSVSNIPAVREAVHRGLKAVVEAIFERSGAAPAEVQLVMAYGLLCHLIVTAGLDQIDAGWAHALTDGMAHPRK